MDIRIAIVTCSDTRDMTADEAGAALKELIRAQGWTVASHEVVHDEVDEISAAIVRAADDNRSNIVITCGGTGLSLRDVTPEATRAVCDRDVPGIAEAMRAYSMTKTSSAGARLSSTSPDPQRRRANAGRGSPTSSSMRSA